MGDEWHQTWKYGPRSLAIRNQHLLPGGSVAHHSTPVGARASECALANSAFTDFVAINYDKKARFNKLDSSDDLSSVLVCRHSGAHIHGRRRRPHQLAKNELAEVTIKGYQDSVVPNGGLKNVPVATSGHKNADGIDVVAGYDKRPFDCQRNTLITTYSHKVATTLE
jgi:hypothetical protein